MTLLLVVLAGPNYKPVFTIYFRYKFAIFKSSQFRHFRITFSHQHSCLFRLFFQVGTRNEMLYRIEKFFTHYTSGLYGTDNLPITGKCSTTKLPWT